jgi:L,D-transpeptidase YcbB
MASKQKSFLILVTAILFLYGSIRAADTLAIKEIIQKIESDKNFAGTLQINQSALLVKFYRINGFRSAWFEAGMPQRFDNLLAMINNAGDYLLTPSAYRLAYLSRLKTNPPVTAADSLYAEIKCSDAALSFLHDVAYGEGPPALRYNGLAYHPGCIELPGILTSALQNNNLQACADAIEPLGEKYRLLKAEFKKLAAVMAPENFREITVSDKTIALTNTALIDKLKQLHYLAGDSITKNDLVAAINTLQKQHNLLVQNKINQYTREVLNETVAGKLKELQWNMRWYRWLNCMRLHAYIVLNLPANRLGYIERGMEKFSCKVVVGKTSTPTPTLTSSIKQVIYYPYWNVPYSIAVKEMLPAIRRNTGYLAKNHYEVLQGGKPVNPSGINWWQYSAGNFPFDIRQLPGCYNALGRLKFDFENPFSVYLHDTNNKSAFLAGKRFFSHGCMRVEKPYELALAIGVDAEKINMDSCLTGMKPQIIPLAKPVPVFVIYATVDVVNGQLVWFEDAYHKREK